MGSVQWANALMARHARNVFGDRVVNLVTTRVVSLAATPEAARAALLRRAELPGWWVPLDASAAHCLVVDPVTANASREFQPLANVFALSMPAGAGAHETDLPLALLPASCVQPVMDVSVPRATLVDWISGRLPADEQFHVDYLRLHVGRQYRAALVALMRQLGGARDPSVHDDESVHSLPSEPGVAEPPSSPGGQARRRGLLSSPMQWRRRLSGGASPTASASRV